MAALLSDRPTPERSGLDRVFPVAANARIYAGALVMLNAGNAQAGAAGAGLVSVGIAEERADNTGGAAGAIQVRVRRGTFRLGNSGAADAITRAEIGSPCYAVDDQTVAKTDGGGTRSRAGTIADVDAVGVWVEI